MGKMLDRDVLIAHLERMMAARQIDRLPKSGYAKAIEDVAGCPTVEPGADRAKVIKGLECCTNGVRVVPDCEHCPYIEIGGTCTALDRLHRDALELLRTQEPKHGKWIPHPGARLWDVCTACGIGCKRREEDDGAEIEYSYLYCPNCGARMDGGDHDGEDA